MTYFKIYTVTAMEYLPKAQQYMITQSNSKKTVVKASDIINQKIDDKGRFIWTVK